MRRAGLSGSRPEDRSIHPPGLQLWRELSFLCAAGLHPLDALRTATTEAAAQLGQGRLGRLAPGCIADLVLVEGDPTREIPSRPRVTTVVKSGIIYDPAALPAAASADAATALDEPLGQAFVRYFGGERQAK